MVFALPAGAVIWLIANIQIGGASLAEHMINWLDPLGLLIGLNGVILLAYVVAIPANEIVIPTVLMLTVLMTGMSGVGRGRRRHVRAGADAAPRRRILDGRRLDAADGGQPDAVQPGPQPVLHDDLHDLEGDRQRQVDRRGHPAAAGHGLCRGFLVAQVWRLFF